MKIGFTGTRQGMTPQQRTSLSFVLRAYVQTNGSNRLPFHHGDCIGADSEAHNIARDLGCYIIIHPPTKSSNRAYRGGDFVHATLPYMDRNRAIVAECDVIIGCPKEYDTVRRSGTWATMRFAQRAGKPVVMIRPDGEVVTEDGK